MPQHMMKMGEERRRVRNGERKGEESRTRCAVSPNRDGNCYNDYCFLDLNDIFSI